MKNIIYLSLFILIMNSCNNSKPRTKMNISVPFTIDQKRESIPKGKIHMDSGLFISISEVFNDVNIGELYSTGYFVIKDSLYIELVSESPTEHYRGNLLLISFTKDQTPIDFLKVMDLGEINKTVVEKDTITIYIDFEFSGWLKKYTTNDLGHFILLSEEKVWENDYDPN